ncbi:hypothetical protein Desor_0692 [Desulfosporosinus orientis DSM 765]|uniref:Uncharacterized protein n=1 Tax=Desulfosporosinus orientis (strain ATCC 19365 / DSM 765 / NCIMB 8382 / VKM B-1628 / Singapore I) TaxID=768706 RepID=G7W5F3_DESOD|nr:hypothetical protein [Desulfosporosinus orientis]AET66381.1 hypothetical protein Desor_0692 [Desulfosporosinus orientis DSM 765]
MSHKDKATRESLASELGELKAKYSQLEKAYSELKDQALPSSPRQLDTFYHEAYIEAASELGHS